MVFVVYVFKLLHNFFQKKLNKSETFLNFYRII
jgi:hypothetical protein